MKQLTLCISSEEDTSAWRWLLQKLVFSRTLGRVERWEKQIPTLHCEYKKFLSSRIMLFSFLSWVIFNLIQHPLVHFLNSFHGLGKPKVSLHEDASHGYQVPWKIACLFLQKFHFSLRKQTLKANIYYSFCTKLSVDFLLLHTHQAKNWSVREPGKAVFAWPIDLL